MGFFSSVIASVPVNTVLLTGRPQSAADLPPMPEVNFDLAGMSQFSHMVGILLSWIMFIIPLLAAVVILLGVLYIVVPPIRNLLDGGRGRFREGQGDVGMQGMDDGMGGMDGGMGMQQGGMGMQGGGMGMGGMQGGGMGMGGMQGGMGGMRGGMGGMRGGMGGSRGGGGRGKNQQGMPRFGPSFVLPIAINIGLMQEGSWPGVKMYLKETLVLMIFVGLMLAITSIGTIFGLGFNIGVMIMKWLSGASESIPTMFEDAAGPASTGFN